MYKYSWSICIIMYETMAGMYINSINTMVYMLLICIKIMVSMYNMYVTLGLMYKCYETLCAHMSSL